MNSLVLEVNLDRPELVVVNGEPKPVTATIGGRNNDSQQDHGAGVTLNVQSRVDNIGGLVRGLYVQCCRVATQRAGDAEVHPFVEGSVLERWGIGRFRDGILVRVQCHVIEDIGLEHYEIRYHDDNVHYLACTVKGYLPTDKRIGLRAFIWFCVR